MSLLIALQTGEGLIMAIDPTGGTVPAASAACSTDHFTCLVPRLCKAGPNACVGIQGAACLNGQPLAGLIENHFADADPHMGVDDVVSQLEAFLPELLPDLQPKFSERDEARFQQDGALPQAVVDYKPTRLTVAGYAPGAEVDAFFGLLYEWAPGHSEPQPYVSPGHGAFAWHADGPGATILHRLFIGADSAIIQACTAADVTPPTESPTLDLVALWETPLDQGIELVQLLAATARRVLPLLGVPTVEVSPSVAVVTPTEGFRRVA